MTTHVIGMDHTAGSSLHHHSHAATSSMMSDDPRSTGSQSQGVAPPQQQSGSGGLVLGAGPGAAPPLVLNSEAPNNLFAYLETLEPSAVAAAAAAQGTANDVHRFIATATTDDIGRREAHLIAGIASVACSRAASAAEGVVSQLRRSAARSASNTGSSIPDASPLKLISDSLSDPASPEAGQAADDLPFGALYSQPAPCLAILHALPSLAQVVLIRLMLLDGSSRDQDPGAMSGSGMPLYHAGVQEADVLSWFRLESREAVRQELARLVRLSVIIADPPLPLASQHPELFHQMQKLQNRLRRKARLITHPATTAARLNAELDSHMRPPVEPELPDRLYTVRANFRQQLISTWGDLSGAARPSGHEEAARFISARPGPLLPLHDPPVVEPGMSDHERAAIQAQERQRADIHPLFAMVTRRTLAQHARSRWAVALRHLVEASGYMSGMQWTEGGTSGSDPKADDQLTPPLISELLDKCQLLQRDSTGSLRITRRGFKFLLQDRNRQLWTLLIKYTQLAPPCGHIFEDVLTLFVQLAYMTVGRIYSCDQLTTSQNIILSDLHQLGLVYYVAQGEDEDYCNNYFFPTPLASTLLGSGLGEDASEATGDAEGFIIVESNFRLYAFTSSPLQASLLSHFATPKHSFDGLLVYQIEYASAKAAFEQDITAVDITEYLLKNSHPQSRKQEYWIPVTVAEQLEIWYQEYTADGGTGRREKFRPLEHVVYGPAGAPTSSHYSY
ncbi:hypothetical protein H696_02329 [Fonticula alba]|uniref:General transcription factor IIH subunit 4 n=1 Tax=Fonticula alba TaxID=691883 RepID=A0A058ZBS9_FONAL|nr:hypothetical protein H696_02329 [Fonticula alba]KCV71378.1 hypothetical protein H696_02329 [Fonticula alba]|eukprot:XP_009494501.1 hypothetical protein H696_02329 [Fonticula alba]